MSTNVRSNSASAYVAPANKDSLARLDSRPWLPPFVLTCVTMLNLVGLLLIARRLGGALQDPFPTGHMLFTALITTALAAYCRTAWRQEVAWGNPAAKTGRDHYNWSRFDRWVGWGSSLGLGLLAVGCTYPAERLVDWLVWFPLLVADQFWRQSYFDGRQPAAPLLSGIFGRRKAEEGKRKASNPAPPLNRSQPGGLASSTSTQPSPHLTEDDEQLLQQLFRVRNTAGQETIYGTLRADFEVGQRNASLYVGFCPPLARRPQVEAEPIAGPAATLKVVQAQAHGARLDLRLDRPAHEECHVLVDLAALGTD